MKQTEIGRARMEASRWPSHTACRFCQHAVREHNRIEGCRFCTCAGTPGEASPQSQEEAARNVLMEGAFRHGYEPEAQALPPVSKDGIKPRWGVLLDDLGSMDIYDSREQAEAARWYEEDGVQHAEPLVRIDYTVVATAR